ncbi:hypothetical protein Dimus_008224 [Dionaea muscipula]
MKSESMESKPIDFEIGIHGSEPWSGLIRGRLKRSGGLIVVGQGKGALQTAAKIEPKASLDRVGIETCSSPERVMIERRGRHNRVMFEWQGKHDRDMIERRTDMIETCSRYVSVMILSIAQDMFQ